MSFLMLFVLFGFPQVSPSTSLETLGRFDTRSLSEASGIIKSRRHPGIFWVHNDSGNTATLFAIRRDGSIVREFPLAVPNLDWEDITIDDQGRLYLGDTGNNGLALPIRTIYQFDEPDPQKPSGAPLIPRSAWCYRFPESGRFDAEGLFLQEGGKSAVLVSKRHDGGPAELFAVSLTSPAPLLRPILPLRVGELPGFIEPATDACLTEDGQLLAVCTDAVTRIYRLDPHGSWSLLAEIRYTPVAVEGITWDGTDLLLVSERLGIHRIAESLWRKHLVAPPNSPHSVRQPSSSETSVKRDRER